MRHGHLNSHALSSHVRDTPADRERELDQRHEILRHSQRIEHAGYQREVISINPQYYTPDGEVVEDEDEVDDEDECLDENVYADIKLEGTFITTIHRGGHVMG